MPRAPKACGHRGCDERVRGRTYCDDHEPEAWAGSISQSTRAWYRVRDQVLDEEPTCRDCELAPSTEAGHIVARARGGTDDRANLKGQCTACNLAQLAEDRHRL
ncbi:HNH endonuclease signature motif containing protein [Pseudonocardia kongjuensis]|uniref:HNH endonuclease signature motif containing protein n=1 Tax=Pseudonocardia kongjuensis TaxID=102227 RepID=A0ABP4J2N0_9PSEU